MKPRFYLDAITSKTAKRRHQRKLQKRRQALAETKLSISSQLVLRTLKPSVRRQLAKERIPSLWILPDDINFRSTQREGPYPSASLLDSPAELRQYILVMSYDVRQMAQCRFELFGEKPRKKPRAGKLQAASERPLTGLEYSITKRINSRAAELCLVSRVVSEDMRYVGKHWQHAIEAFMHEKIDVDTLRVPDFTIRPDPHYSGPRQRSVVIKGDDRSLKGRRPGKCWYCTERHVPGQLGCPKSIEDPQRWLRETRALGGWRSRTQMNDSFKVTKVVSSE